MFDREVTGTEEAIFGTSDLDAILSKLDGYVREHLGTGIAAVIFRAGRVDSVWAVHLSDHRDVVLKAHRPPPDLSARMAASRAQRQLMEAGFPCPSPVIDAGAFEGLVLSAESLVTSGVAGDARKPDIRRALARGLHEHITILRASPELVAAAGPGPAWCRYQDGAWPTPHDPVFDFRTTPLGFEWLDGLANTAAARLRAARHDEIAVGHADWYIGNARFDGNELVGTFDWDLVAAPEPFIAGFAAATFTDRGTDVQDLPDPDEVRAFLRDYDYCRDAPFSTDQQSAAAAAVTWALAYNARCQLSFLQGDPARGSALDLLLRSRDAYVQMRW